MPVADPLTRDEKPTSTTPGHAATQVVRLKNDRF